MTFNRFPEIDYPAHLGFSSLEPAFRTQVDAQAVAQQIHDIDLSYAKVLALTAPTETTLRALFAETTATLVSTLTTQLQAELAEPRLSQWVNVGIAKALDLMLHNALSGRCGVTDFALDDKATRANGVTTERMCAHAEELHSDGFTRLSISTVERDELLALAAPYCAQLKQRAEANPGGRMNMPLPQGAAVMRRLGRLLHRNGAMEIGQANRKKPIEIDSFSLHYAHAGQDWYRNCYADVGLSTAKLAYLHYDRDATCLKVLTYLNPVHEGAGAFGFVRGSGQWQRSEFGFALRNFLMPALDQYFPVRDSGNYYRAFFSDPEARRVMLSLPPALHGSSHYGDDIVDGTQWHQQVASALTPITGETGCVLFDGGRGLHIGGITNTEPRWAIQLNLRPSPSRSAFQQLKRLGRQVQARLRDV
jgi:hypothetical protein